MCKSSW